MNLLKSFLITALMFSLAITSISYADKESGDMEEIKPYNGSAEFERIKSLEGTWTGTADMHGKETSVTINYETSSGGSVVIETMMPGTPHEMVSIYYEEDGKLMMKHYCLLYNQPVMAMTNSDADSIELELVEGDNMDESKDMHMHSVTFTFNGDNEMTQSWTSYKDGKPEGESSDFTFKRQS